MALQKTIVTTFAFVVGLSIISSNPAFPTVQQEVDGKIASVRSEVPDDNDYVGLDDFDHC